jgi:hypothetical protein
LHPFLLQPQPQPQRMEEEAVAAKLIRRLEHHRGQPQLCARADLLPPFLVRFL